MKTATRVTATLSVLVMVNGCASVPKVSRPYYFPEAKADVAITQTLGCKVTDAQKPLDVGAKPLVRSTATATVAYSYVPNYVSPKKHSIAVEKVDRFVSDSDLTIVLMSDDGRLSSINSNNGGDASAIVKSIASVASVFTGVKILDVDGLLAAKEVSKSYCANIIQYGAAVDKDKQPGIYTLTLNYKQKISFKDGVNIFTSDNANYEAGKGVPIPLDPGSTPFSTSANLFPAFSFQLVKVESQDIQPQWNASEKKGPFVEVPAMKLLTLKMTGPVADMSQTGDFWTDTVLVPTDTPVQIPLPKAPWFGKLNASMQFSNSGLVNKLEYNKTNGVSDLFSAGAQIANQASPATQTAAQKAADVQAQSDLIYQQQRLITCQLSPKSCPSK